MNTYDINSNEHILESLIERALLDTVVWISNRCGPQEPDYVAALSTKFLKTFFNILVAVFPNYDFSVSGVYCHQKPIVDINLDKKPELGDIIFVYADRKQNGEKILNSLLLQAKISKHPWLKIHQSESHQLELYKKWPEFTYCRAGYLNGVKRNILPKAINDGAQYLLIDDNPLTNGILGGKGMFPMGCSVPDDVLFINNSLSKELINLLKFKSGHTFDSNPYSTEDGWSKMIWDLLAIAAFKYTKRKNAHLKSFSRSNECNHFCTENMSGITLLDEALDDCKIMEDEIDENGGVSVVLFESQLKREQGEYDI
ncbi:MAG: hypothetical protein HDT40_07720 [Lachnospiraceae bacterium]|nr:hypothetical protein [Lachnospiraceae bacterium]